MREKCGVSRQVTEISIFPKLRELDPCRRVPVARGQMIEVIGSRPSPIDFLRFSLSSHDFLDTLHRFLGRTRLGIG